MCDIRLLAKVKVKKDQERINKQLYFVSVMSFTTFSTNSIDIPSAPALI
jgi:hypothetical protein